MITCLMWETYNDKGGVIHERVASMRAWSCVFHSMATVYHCVGRICCGILAIKMWFMGVLQVIVCVRSHEAEFGDHFVIYCQ